MQIFEDFSYAKALDKLKLKYFTGVYQGPEMMKQQMAILLEELETKYELENQFRQHLGAEESYVRPDEDDSRNTQQLQKMES